MGFFSRILGKPESNHQKITDDEREEITRDLAKEMAKRIHIGEGPGTPLPPIEESEAFKRFERSGLQCGTPIQKDQSIFVDYDRLFLDAIAGLPNDVAPILTTIGNTDPICPYCNAVFPKKPKAKTKCKACGNFVYVRTRPLDGYKILVTDDQIQEVMNQELVKNGVYSETRNIVKENLKHFQKSGYPGWKFVGVCDEGSPKEERALHGHIIKPGSPEEQQAIETLCRIDVRAVATAWFGDD